MCNIIGNPEHFQILRFNVEGLKNKLGDPNFLELIQNICKIKIKAATY